MTTDEPAPQEGVHPTACVDPGAELGPGVAVGPFAVIGARVRIGEGTSVGPHAVIHSGTTLGRHCRVHAGAVLGDTPQDLSFSDVDSSVEIGDACVIREGVTVHRGTKEHTSTRMGDGCYLMAFSHLAHNVQLGNKVILANGALLGGYVEVGEGAFISALVVVHQFTRIGRLAMLGGKCGLSKDVPPFCTVLSAQINKIAGLNVVGLRRGGFSPAERKEIKGAFRILYRDGLRAGEAVQRIREAYPEGPARELAEFTAASERGICRLAESVRED